MQERLRSPPIRDRGAYEREATEMRLRLNTQHKEKASAAEVADQEARAAMQTAAAALQAARELEMKAVNMLEAATTIIHTMRRRLKRRRRRAAVAIQSRLRAHFCASNQICSSRAVLFILRGSRSAHARAIRRMMAARRANGIAAGSSGGSADEGKVAAMQQVTRRSMRIERLLGFSADREGADLKWRQLLAEQVVSRLGAVPTTPDRSTPPAPPAPPAPSTPPTTPMAPTTPPLRRTPTPSPPSPLPPQLQLHPQTGDVNQGTPLPSTVSNGSLRTAASSPVHHRAPLRLLKHALNCAFKRTSKRAFPQIRLAVLSRKADSKLVHVQSLVPEPSDEEIAMASHVYAASGHSSPGRSLNDNSTIMHAVTGSTMEEEVLYYCRVLSCVPDLLIERFFALVYAPIGSEPPRLTRADCKQLETVSKAIREHHHSERIQSHERAMQSIRNVQSAISSPDSRPVPRSPAASPRRRSPTPSLSAMSALPYPSSPDLSVTAYPKIGTAARSTAETEQDAPLRV